MIIHLLFDKKENKYIIYWFTEPLGALPKGSVVGWLIGTKTFTPLSAYLELGENYSSVARGDIDFWKEQNYKSWLEIVTLLVSRDKKIEPVKPV